MKILQIAPLITSAGDYGGPARVAINQSRSLMQLGHEVRLLAATWRSDPRPASIDEVPIILFPGISLYPGAKLRALASPLLIQWLRKHVSHYDVVHLHLARDFITLPALWFTVQRRIPVIAQPHGMLIPSGNRTAERVDQLVTYPLVRRISLLLYLTDAEERMLARAAPEVARQRISNGVTVEEEQPQAPCIPAPLWRPGSRQRVLFVGRLHPVKRPLHFVYMAAQTLQRFPDADFLMVGPDQGLGASVEQLITQLDLSGSVRWIGPLSHEGIQVLLPQAQVLVLPSESEQFPLAVVEAMAAGVPVVLTPNCGISEAIDAHGAGIVAEYSSASLADALERLLRNDAYRSECGVRARRLVQSQMNALAVGSRLEQLYKETLDRVNLSPSAR